MPIINWFYFKILILFINISEVSLSNKLFSFSLEKKIFALVVFPVPLSIFGRNTIARCNFLKNSHEFNLMGPKIL